MPRRIISRRTDPYTAISVGDRLGLSEVPARLVSAA